MDFAFVLDGLIVVLLGVTIGYAVVLNRRLQRLRAGESEMRQVIESFNEATATAEANLARIRGVAEAAGASDRSPAAAQARLGPLVEEARRLATDLNMLIARGEEMFDAASTRPAARNGARQSPAAVAAKPANPAIEQELINALRDAR